MKNKLLSGTFWMMLGSILSRILGIIYLIPWLMMIGSPSDQNAAQAIFNAAYTPYALFLSLGVAGFPTAIARQVAEYNGQNRFKDSVHVFKYGMLFMLFTGSLCGLLLYIFAPMIAQRSAVVSTEVATTAIRVMVPTLIILPPMSMIRGFYQGNSDMQPMGVSQLWEQLIRVLFILGATYWIMLIQHGSYIKAVNYSTFATFIGALASYIYLIAYSRKRMGHYRKLYHESVPVHEMHVFTIFKNIFKEALPFIFVGSAITIYQFIDQLTFKDIMVELTGLDALQAQDLYTYFSANPSKITTVVISLTIAISESSLPLLATLAKQNDKHQIGKTIAQNVELMLLTLLPSSLLLAVLSWEVNGVFFPFSRLGANLLAYALVTSIALALFTDFFTIVQSLGKHRLAVRYLTLGIILKLALQVPLTYLFGAYGALSATTVSFLLISLGVYGQIKKHYLVRGQMKNVKLIIVINLLVALMAYLTNKLISLVYLPQNKLTAFLYAAVFGGIFVLLYIALLNKSGIFKEVFGFKVKLAVKGKH